MTNDALPDYVRALLEPASYPHTPASVELVQTHISYVFLADDVVYKTKKPIDFGFIQQLDAETRQRFCEAEVRLNRRLAPDVYLDTVPIARLADGGYAVEHEGEPGSEVIEHAVKMRRLPNDRTLDHLLAAGDLPEGLIKRIVDRLVTFHGTAEVVADDRDFAGAPAERAWWQREYGEAEDNIGGTWLAEDAAALRSYVDATVEREAALFDERLALGRVVEGHGDLQAKHVYALSDDVDDLVIVDCIEFNDWFHFRYLDVGYDVAFLAMDLEALGRSDLGDEFAGRYIAVADDETIGVLQPLHRAFRAFVRGKVESIGAHAEEVPAEQREQLAASAASYFRLSADYARRTAAPSLTVLVGASGTGKTLVGATLAGRIGAALVSSDLVRRELAEAEGLSAAMWQQYEAGAYSPEMNRRTYEGMRERAAAHLADGRPVILDATHSRADGRAEALRVASEAGVPAVLAELQLADDAAFARLTKRERRAGTEVDERAYREHIERFEAVQVGEAETQIVFDAAQPPASLALEIAAALPSSGA
ncbi:MAG TPA: AAA family ATPase [Dehalococcoidia bacterium]|nr:AAA family ATPase [Dehalococcoidia bacterium]